MQEDPERVHRQPVRTPVYVPINEQHVLTAAGVFLNQPIRADIFEVNHLPILLMSFAFLTLTFLHFFTADSLGIVNTASQLALLSIVLVEPTTRSATMASVSNQIGFVFTMIVLLVMSFKVQGHRWEITDSWRSTLALFVFELICNILSYVILSNMLHKNDECGSGFQVGSVSVVEDNSRLRYDTNNKPTSFQSFTGRSSRIIDEMIGSDEEETQSVIVI